MEINKETKVNLEKNRDKENLRKIRHRIKNIKSIDNGVRKYLIELNSLGYLTCASCSGIISEHKKMENWSKRRNKDLDPGVSILVKCADAKKIFFNLRQILYGTGWHVEYPIAYRCYRDGREIPFNSSKSRYFKKLGGYYVPIHIQYTTKCNDMKKTKAWNILVQLLE